MKTDDTTQVETLPAPAPDSAKRTAPDNRKAWRRAGVFKPKADTRETPERVTQAGAIRIENEEALRAVPLFCYSERGHWYSADGQGSYARVTESQAKVLVAEYGFNRKVADSLGNTPAERAMCWLNQNKRVAFAGALAGYPAGLHESGGIRFLLRPA